MTTTETSPETTNSAKEACGRSQTSAVNEFFIKVLPLPQQQPSRAVDCPQIDASQAEKILNWARPCHD